MTSQTTVSLESTVMPLSDVPVPVASATPFLVHAQLESYLSRSVPFAPASETE